LEYFAGICADQEGVRIVPHPLVAGRRHLQGKQPVIRDEVGGCPIRARQSLPVNPVMGRPTLWPMVWAYLEAPRCLEVMMVCVPVHCGRTRVPAVGLVQTLIPFRARVCLAVWMVRRPSSARWRAMFLMGFLGGCC